MAVVYLESSFFLLATLVIMVAIPSASTSIRQPRLLPERIGRDASLDQRVTNHDEIGESEQRAYEAVNEARIEEQLLSMRDELASMLDDSNGAAASQQQHQQHQHQHQHPLASA
eukprot:TRINITY_DN13741_c0_g1_i1.p1 TRINITY_DN13741_c0_g1~~TRINITY_DN13741_c0_g1_i1.p1  ORF type:complete len:114 (+),score=22.71 TRINITY_DN13741_c0_g1_i1:59-400(+)